jgi:hypothetical protein
VPRILATVFSNSLKIPGDKIPQKRRRTFAGRIHRLPPNPGLKFV